MNRNLLMGNAPELDGANARRVSSGPYALQMPRGRTYVNAGADQGG